MNTFAFETLEFDKIRERLSVCASSVLGAEKALALQPLQDQQDCRLALNQTTELADLLRYDQALPIDGISDIRPVLKKLRIEASRLDPEELVKINRTLYVSRQCDRYFKARKEKLSALSAVTRHLLPDPELEQAIEKAIDSTTFAIRDSASPELKRIRERITKAQAGVRNKIESLVKNLGEQGLLQENIIAVRSGRLVLMVKDEYKRKIKGLVHDRSASGSSLFVEPMQTVEDNNRVRELYADEEREIHRILLELSEKCRAKLNDLDNNLHTLTQLDLIYAKAVFSNKMEGQAPELSSEKSIHLAQARHPLLILRMPKSEVVPLNLELNDDKRIMVISGPNAGGKTVVLKTVGLLTLMAMSGCHIPAEGHSKIAFFHRIYALIGDQQSIENDLSTFSSHLNSLKDIVSSADEQSLVLIDEIASGTDPEEGSALAISVLEALCRLASLAIVTTHQSALKAFAYQTDHIENASMEFDVLTLQPTYHFREGVPGSSYAFEIASRMGLNSKLVERARELVGAHKNRLEGLILELEERIQRHKELIREASIKETELRGLTNLYKERTQSIKRETHRLKKQAVQEAEEILRQANAAVENAVREIKESQAAKDKIKTVRQKLYDEKQKLNKHKQPSVSAESSSQELSIGDHARWTKMGAQGVIASKPDKRNRVLLETDMAKLWVPVKELLPSKPSKEGKKGGVKFNYEREEPVSDEIDLRGLRADQACDIVDKTIDEALLMGLKTIRVIHGKGTGVLRKQIHDFLANHAHVLLHRIGHWNEGDSGVTIVQLRDGQKE
jgi:DNA mismatch repair protein MutS2